jgi:REP element-mobilizing transposase RayT
MMKTIRRYSDECEDVFGIQAYCLLPNHMHMMTRVVDADRFSLSYGRILQAYAMYFKKKYQTPKGQPVYESRFKAKHIDTDEYRTQCHSYITHNAVHHGLVDDTADRPRTSHHDDPVAYDETIDMTDREF